ncbi:HTH-type transcriptional activator IlvY [Ferrimonas pelagia]|uniref:HTH-type transcriptional activator IlvY n=1 Tax=Ferrimonas pelagia TaxID=1177826 RepID=A0ABP9FHK9_9GAMM
MDIRSLQLFHHLATHLHFGKTAQANHVSPSTLSRSIQRIEQELGTTLLQRDNRSVRLTPAGERFRDYAAQQLLQWQELKHALNDRTAELSGQLRLYCSVTAAYSHLPAMLDQFRRHHPAVELILSTGDAAAALDQLKFGDVDLAIAASDGDHAMQYYIKPLAQISVAVVGPTIPCAIQQQLSHCPIDWRQIPLIMPEHGQTRRRIETWYRRKQLGKPKIYATVSGHEALVSMVALGCGVGIAPHVVIDNSPVKSRLQPLTGPEEIPPFGLGIACQRNRQHEPLIQAFLDVVSPEIFDSGS